VYLWIGNGAPSHTKSLAKKCAQKLSDKLRKSLVQEREGDETGSMKEFVDKGCGEFVSMIEPLPDSNSSHSTRLFLMSSVSGEFLVNEIACPFLSKDVPNLLSFNQSDLYSAEQPGNKFALKWQDIRCKQTARFSTSPGY